MTTLTVTATQGGSTANGLVLRVFVVTGAKAVASQTGAATNTNFTSTSTWTQSITTTAGSNVYGAASAGNNGPTLTNSNATVVDNIGDVTNTESYITHKSLNVTGGATARGYTSSASMSGPFAQLEILAAGTLAEDASAPAVVSTTAALTLTTASFTPPAGSLIVALVGSDGGAGVTTYTLTDNLGSHLNWTQKSVNNPSGGDYAGVWIADVPGGVTAPALPLQAPVPPPAPPRPAPSQVIAAPVAYRPVVTLSGSGTLAAVPGVGGQPQIITTVVQPPQPAQPPPARLIGLTPGAFISGAALSGSGTLTAAPFFSGAAALSGSGTLAAAYTVIVPGTGVIQAPLAQPPQPPPPAPSQITGAAPSVTFTVGATLTGSGTLIAAPFFSGAATLSGSGTLTAGPGVGGLPLVIQPPLPQPAQPPLPPASRVLLAPPALLLGSATLTGSGTLAAVPYFAAAAALSGTGTLAAAYTVAGAQPYVITAVIQAPQPPQPPPGQLLMAPGIPLPPPAFTVGTLTASAAATGVLTGVTASGGSGGVLTASDTRTGGPGG